jgi:hypothetical protein
LQCRAGRFIHSVSNAQKAVGVVVKQKHSLNTTSLVTVLFETMRYLQDMAASIADRLVNFPLSPSSDSEEKKTDDHGEELDEFAQRKVQIIEATVRRTSVFLERFRDYLHARSPCNCCW